MGVFANALSAAVARRIEASPRVASRQSGLGAWLAARLRRGVKKEASLLLVGRISLAPRQTIALLEADGERLLVATSADGSPAFFPLRQASSRPRTQRRSTAATEGSDL